MLTKMWFRNSQTASKDTVKTTLPCVITMELVRPTQASLRTTHNRTFIPHSKKNKNKKC